MRGRIKRCNARNPKDSEKVLIFAKMSCVRESEDNSKRGEVLVSIKSSIADEFGEDM